MMMPMMMLMMMTIMQVEEEQLSQEGVLPRENVEYGVLGGGCFAKTQHVELFIKYVCSYLFVLPDLHLSPPSIFHRLEMTPCWANRSAVCGSTATSNSYYTTTM